MHVRKIQTNGNSLCVNIPAAFCATLLLKPGDYIQFSLTVNKQLVLAKVNESTQMEIPCQTS